ncbi:guanylate-binding protein 1-like [Anneissia japonica]|uniref:guanylate-binding protein 1-like n=1 Tax=Anneissia japonica TaxID=1529436 RepID=UPI00142571BE|nr:guanylate-binding protein 1-like [Anneissia japonica]
MAREQISWVCAVIITLLFLNSSLCADENLNLRDEPLQLVKPDIEHKQLILNHDFVKTLYQIEGPVAVAAIVGKYHSGKSFLLNQLMGKRQGFGFNIGPFVKPETMGIWMWGKPLPVTLSSGQKISLIFLDTEGFAANNVSERYDAKIFAVATLLSSYLIYNSVKIIDQADMDYLELLARRTQLFALRSQMSRAKWANDFNHDLLTFPPLMWVVQDFVQAIGDDMSPKEWLEGMMDSSTWESEDHRISLLDVFESVNCHTLFFPATKKDLLQDLSQAREDDLTIEYKNERDSLLQKLKDGIIPKGKNDRPMTGPELASLIDILVTAANEGSLAQVPSRWHGFIQDMKQSAVQDCFKFYDTDMEVLHEKHHHGAINEQELEQWHQQAHRKTLKLLQQVLFGLETIFEESSKEMNVTIQEHFEKTYEMNEKKIKLRCGEIQHRQELSVEEALAQLSLPVLTSQMMSTYNEALAGCITGYAELLEPLKETTAYRKHLNQLKASAENMKNSYLFKNSKAIEAMFEKASELSSAEFKVLTTHPTNDPIIPHDLKRLFKRGAEKALDSFQRSTEYFNEERDYKMYLKVVQTGFTEIERECELRNNYLLKSALDSKIHDLTELMKANTNSTKISLPMNDTELDQILNFETAKVVDRFSEDLDDFRDLPAFQEGIVLLTKSLHHVCGTRRQENMAAYQHEVGVPLDMAKRIALLSADRYDTVFSITLYIKEICLLNLDEGKAANWPLYLKINIIERFIKNDAEIQKLIRERQGLYSMVVGFMQWIRWCLDFLYAPYLFA